LDLIQFYTYKDEFGQDISKAESEFRIKLIYSNYRQELLIGFLGHIAKRIDLDNTLENIDNLQKELIGIEFQKAHIIHRRAHLALWQYFFDNKNFNHKDNRNVLDAKDIFLLFILVNQILDKSEYQKHDEESILHAGFSFLSIDLIQKNDLVASNFFFIKFYEKLISHPLKDEFDKILINLTTYNLEFFRDFCIKLQRREKINHIFNIFENFSVIKYKDISKIWDNRVPKIQKPFDYRFIEKYPLIKDDKLFFPIDFINIFLSVFRKPYHLLSQKNNKFNFRNIFSKEISEPVIKEYIKENFTSDNIKIIETSYNNYEYADTGLLFGDQLILIEIKSVYMGLDLRYTEDKNKFIDGFNKRYIEGAGVRQQIKKINYIETNYNKFIEDCQLEQKKYNIFCLLLVFDESLSTIGVNVYIRNKFNKFFKEEFEQEFNNINPYPYNATITFNELYFLFNDNKSQRERFKILNSFFIYNLSLTEFLYELKKGTIILN
jgi:hypothetical protein